MICIAFPDDQPGTSDIQALSAGGFKEPRPLGLLNYFVPLLLHGLKRFLVKLYRVSGRTDAQHEYGKKVGFFHRFLPLNCMMGERFKLAANKPAGNHRMDFKIYCMAFSDRV